MKRQITPPISPKCTFRILVIENLVIVLAIAFLVLNRIGFIHNPFHTQTPPSYTDNSRYAPYVSMFQLNSDDCDIVFIGDSLTERCHFDELLHTDKTILNRGIGSDMTEGVLNRMDEVLSHNPSKIFLMVGINDIANGADQDEVILHYESILDKIKQSDGSINVYIQSVLPAVKDYNEDIPAFNASLQKLTEKYSYQYVDLYPLFIDGTTVIQDYYASDGVHLNGSGYQVWINAIHDLI